MDSKALMAIRYKMLLDARRGLRKDESRFKRGEIGESMYQKVKDKWETRIENLEWETEQSLRLAYLYY